MTDATAFASAMPQTASDGFAALRREARDRFLSRGWPTRRDESYKYTDLSALERKAWPRAGRPSNRPELPAALGARSVWCDGYLDGTPDGGNVTSLQGCATTPPDALAGLLGQLAPQDDPVAALNTALFDHGAWIELGDGETPDTPLELAHTVARDRGEAAACHGRLALRMGRDSRLVLIERHLGGDVDTLRTRVAEIVLAAGARLLHIRLNEAGDGTRLLGHTTVRAGHGATYRCLTLDLGAKVSREAFVVDLAEDEASATLSGLALLDGKRHADADVRVVHDALRTRSRQAFRGVLDGRSRSVYSGRVVVRPDAQKTDSGQESANLLLSPRAEADTRPQLEIYADDVICNHGAATGAIDPDALFYLRSRGLDADSARRMVAYGFAARVLADLEDATLHRELSSLLARRMQAPREVLEWL